LFLQFVAKDFLVSCLYHHKCLFFLLRQSFYFSILFFFFFFSLSQFNFVDSLLIKKNFVGRLLVNFQSKVFLSRFCFVYFLCECLDKTETWIDWID
jgi:hypothetical protein